MSKQITDHKPKKGGTTMYKLNYQEHITLKQAAYTIMQNYNQKQYNSDKPYNQKQFIKYDQTLAILYKKDKTELLDIIARYITYKEKQDNQKLIETNQRNIIIPKLQHITDQQLETISIKLQQLETKYILDLDTDYTSKQSILESYQQVLAYKYYNIELQSRPEEILIGNTELLERIGN